MKGKPDKSELLLVKQCKQGNNKAQHQLYTRYSKAMYNIATRMTGNKAHAEDILQEAFIKVFTEIHKLQNEKAFGGWVKRIVINKCIDHSRNKKFFSTEIEIHEIENQLIEEEIEDTILPEKVHECIKQLPDGAREILVLRALEGLKHAEIAEQLNISVSTAKTQFHRAKTLMGKLLNKNENKSRRIPEKKPAEA